MAISSHTITAIQQAGQALDAARDALQDASQRQSARVAEAMGSNAFGMENDAMFEHWKRIARMAQAVQAMEEQLRTIHQAASELAYGAPDAGSGARQHPPLRLPSGAPQPDVVDAAPVRRRRTARRPPAAPNASVAPVAPVAGAPKGNAARVLAYLQTVLDRRAFRRVTHGEVVAHAGIPLGSVGAALAGLKDRGLLREGERGSYRLG